MKTYKGITLLFSKYTSKDRFVVNALIFIVTNLILKSNISLTLAVTSFTCKIKKSRVRF